MIEDATLFKSYNCDGAVETFNIVVDYLKDPTNIKIYYVVIATGVQYLLVKDTNYTVDIINNTITTITGSITGLGSTSSPYASGIQLTILLDVPYTQLLDIISNSDYNPESLETAYDKNTLLAKQNQEILNRSVLLQEGDAGTTLVLPPAITLPNGVLAFDETGQPIVQPGFIPRAYSSTYSYQTNDIIQYDGLFYIALQTALDQTPGTAPLYWALYNLQNINAYAGATTYALDAVVAHLGLLYISLQAANTGNTPASSPAYWVVWQKAVAVPITDAGGYYTGSEVETALQEVGPAVGNVNQDLKITASPTFAGITSTEKATLNKGIDAINILDSAGGTITEDVIFDTLSPFVPVIGNKIRGSGAITNSGGGPDNVNVAFIERLSATQIKMFGLNSFTGASSGAGIVTDGSATTRVLTISW